MLTCENRPGRRIRVSPAGSGRRGAGRVHGAASQETPGVTRILLVEDDLSVGTGLEELLNSEGYEATWVKAAGDACEAAADAPARSDHRCESS